MTSLVLVVISTIQAVYAHRDGETVGAIEVQRKLNAVGRKYVRVTQRLLANGRLCPAVVSEAVMRAEARRWRLAHRECAAQIGRVLRLNPAFVDDVLYLYRETIKLGRVSRFADWILEAFKLEAREDKQARH